MNAQKVIVIQTGSAAVETLPKVMRSANLEQGTDYLFFNTFHGVLAKLTPGEPQLVITSHTDEVNAFQAAREVKAVNPEAIVIAYTSNHVGPVEGTELDGYYDKYIVTPGISAIAQAFLQGASKHKLLSMLPK